MLIGSVPHNGKRASKPIYSYNGEVSPTKRKFFITEPLNHITGKVENADAVIISKLANDPQSPFQAIGDNNRKNLAILDFIMQADHANRQRLALEYNENLKEVRRLLAYFNLPLAQTEAFKYKEIPKH